ncbi:MAG: hypothetical protein V4732_22595 [Pseudomonadota bacterium]
MNGKITTLFTISGSVLTLADAIASGYLRIYSKQAPDVAVKDYGENKHA